MLTFHILSFGFVVGVSALADKEAYSWIRGEHEILERKRMHQYHFLVWVGLVGLIASGLYLMWPMSAYLLGNLLFDIKLVFVGILVVNAILVGRLMTLALTKPFRELTFDEKMSLIVSGAISIFGWAGAFALALWIF